MERAARQELVGRLHRLGVLVRLVRQRRSQLHPATPVGMLGVLKMIDEIGAQTPCCRAKELAARAVLDPSTVSRTVAALVTAGLVVRHTDPDDRRASILVLTDTGRRALTEAWGWYDDLLRDALAGWRPDEISALAGALGRLTADVEGALGSTRTSQPLEPIR